MFLLSGLLVLALLGLPKGQPGRSPQPSALAILNVTVIDGTGAQPKSGQTVLLEGDRITAVGDSAQIALPADALTLDATGKFLTPGLWDMHVHALQGRRPDFFFPQFLAAGITGVRDMGSPAPELGRAGNLRNRINNGSLAGPELVYSGPVLDGPVPMFPELSLPVANESEARQAVENLQRAGVTFIKVYGLLPRDAFFAVADECRKRNLPFGGHVPDSVTAAEASDAGQASIEHLTGVILSCSRLEGHLRDRLLSARSSNDPALVYQALTAIQNEGLATYDATKAEALFQNFARNGTWQVPTIVTTRAIFRNGDLRAGSLDDDRKRRGRRVIQQTFQTRASMRDAGLEVPASLLSLIREMRKSGVRFLAGTDTPNPLAPPGTSLHRELELFVRAGFSPMEALQAATIKPAEYLGYQDRLGTIEVGKLADLALLDADPLADIRNVSRVFAVVLRGRLILKSETEELQARAEATAPGLLSSFAGTGLGYQKSRTSSAPRVAPGDRDWIVEAEQRLSDLGYWTGPVDGVPDEGLRHALIAFQKVEGLPRTGKLAVDDLNALRSAKRPAPFERGPFHIEIDLSRQVLFVVEETEVKRILQVSTGNNRWFTSAGWTRQACTPCGTFKIYRKIAGWHKSELGRLYYPNYIVGGVAIHGSRSVPVAPASHGCIRIPMYAAKEFSEKTPIGTPVVVHASNPQP